MEGYRVPYFPVIACVVTEGCVERRMCKNK